MCVTLKSAALSKQGLHFINAPNKKQILAKLNSPCVEIDLQYLIGICLHFEVHFKSYWF